MERDAVMIFDEWAGVTTDEHPIPVVPVAGFVLAVFARVDVARRRRTE